MTNPVEPIKSKVVGLIPVRIMLTNQLFLFNLLFFSAPFQTLYAPKALSPRRPIKALKLPTQSMIQLDLPQISLSISPQLLAGSANAQFGKTQFFLRHPVVYIAKTGIIVWKPVPAAEWNSYRKKERKKRLCPGYTITVGEEISKP